MNQLKSARILETLHHELQNEDFQVLDLAFLGSLLPGIIHNMSTPLSGVIGATQLLEMRAAAIEEAIAAEKIDSMKYAELKIQLERNRANYDVITRNAKRLSEILQILVHRINRSGSETQEYYSLNELVQSEILFLDANLNFKHKVKKTLSLGAESTPVKYAYCHVATLIDEFVSLVLSRHDFKQGMIEMDFCTSSSEDSLTLAMRAHYIQSVHEINSDSLNTYLKRLKSANWQICPEEEKGYLSLTLHLCKSKP